MNEIHIIMPYRKPHGLWVFDAPAVGLRQEPFVSDMSDIIDTLTVSLPDAQKGFVALFSAHRFNGATIEFTLVGSDNGRAPGNTYRCEQTGTTGWLCPALYRYFPKAPKKIYAQFLPRKKQHTAGTNKRKDK